MSIHFLTDTERVRFLDYLKREGQSHRAMVDAISGSNLQGMEPISNRHATLAVAYSLVAADIEAAETFTVGGP